MIEILSRNVGVDYVNRNENFEALEVAFNEAHNKYSKIRTIKDKLDFGSRLSHRHIAELAPQVMNEVHQFLGVEKPEKEAKISLFWLRFNLVHSTAVHGLVIMLPGVLGSIVAGFGISAFSSDAARIALVGGILSSITLGAAAAGTSFTLDVLNPRVTTQYLPSSRKIVLGPYRERGVVGALSHEYTHHLQFQSWGESAMREMAWLREGHARAVENNISHSFSETSENPAYEITSSKRLLMELHEAYTSACKTKGVQPSVSFMHLKVDRILDPRVKFLTGDYNLGSAVFSIAQEKHGVAVNKDIMKGDFSFLGK